MVLEARYGRYSRPRLSHVGVLYRQAACFVIAARCPMLAWATKNGVENFDLHLAPILRLKPAGIWKQNTGCSPTQTEMGLSL
jgi:hypothetical protein